MSKFAYLIQATDIVGNLVSTATKTTYRESNTLAKEWIQYPNVYRVEISLYEVCPRRHRKSYYYAKTYDGQSVVCIKDGKITNVRV